MAAQHFKHNIKLLKRVCEGVKEIIQCKQQRHNNHRDFSFSNTHREEGREKRATPWHHYQKINKQKKERHKQAHANPYVAYLSFGKECENNENEEDEDVISSPFMNVNILTHNDYDDKNTFYEEKEIDIKS